MNDLDYSAIAVTARYSPWKGDPEFQKVYQEIKGNTLVEETRCWVLWDLLRQCRGAGDIIEVGVWKGGTGCLLAARARQLGYSSQVYLCDTWSGVPRTEITDKDPVYRGGEHSDAALADVRSLANRLGLTNIVLVQGIFPESLPIIPPCKFLHVDVDVYRSAKRTTDAVVPRILPGQGIAVYDDYGFPNCGGVTRYVNELKSSGVRVVYNLTGQAIAFF